MGSHKEILKSEAGVTLTKVSLMGPNGPLSTAYSVKSLRTPESWMAGDVVSAERLFNEEVARCTGSSR